MDKIEFSKRLKKCSFDSIVDVLFTRGRAESTLRDIEFREYEGRSKELLKKIFQSTSQIELFLEQKDFFKCNEEHKNWRQLHKQLDKLNKWFDERESIQS